MSPIRVEFTPVNSTNISAIGHVIGHGLFVDFHNGRRYVYKDVPSEIHDALLRESGRKNGSVGREFHKLVKNGGFEYEEVETG